MTRTELLTLNKGYLVSSKDFDDYSIKAGEKYKIKTAEWGSFIHTDNTIRLNNNELRDDVVACLTWQEN